MQVIVNTDKNVELTEESIGALEELVTSKLEHVSSRLTRVELHLSNASAGRSTGDDIRCRVEARPEGRNPEIVTDDASSVDSAVAGALGKLARLLDTVFGRADHRKGRTSMGGAEQQ